MIFLPCTCTRPRTRILSPCLFFVLAATIIALTFGAAGCRAPRRPVVAVASLAADARGHEHPDSPAASLSEGEGQSIADPGTGDQPDQISPEPLYVHVSGAVANPGVYVLPAGARAWDGVQAAGGLSPQAAPSAVNLASPLVDGQQLHIPAKGEYVASWTSTGASMGLVGSAPAVAGSGGPASSGAGGIQRVDLNTAGAAALNQLPGIGPVLAQRILTYRATHGPFASLDDLLRVSGIGPKKLADLREYVVLR